MASVRGKDERKCMGIEPTNRRLDRRLNDFEDREGHQPAKHFRALFLPCFLDADYFLFLDRTTNYLRPGSCTTCQITETGKAEPARGGVNHRARLPGR
jgi:hypothetical protein